MQRLDRTPAVTRRTALGACLFAVLASSGWAEAAVIVPESADLADVIAPRAALSLVYSGGSWCEGPVWIPRLNGLVFSDVQQNRMMRIGAGGEISAYRQPSANANGSALDREQRLVTCEHLNRRVVREELDGRLIVLADQFEGRPLNSPNDV